MVDQTNAEVSDERLREIAEQSPEGRILRPKDAERSEVLAIATELLNRRSVTSQASEGEVVALRSIIAKCAAALGNGAFIDPERATVEFMSHLPTEIAFVVAPVSKRVERLETALALLLAKVGDVLGQLGPGGYLLPSGAGLTNALSSAATEARQALQGGRS